MAVPRSLDGLSGSRSLRTVWLYQTRGQRRKASTCEGETDQSLRLVGAAEDVETVVVACTPRSIGERVRELKNYYFVWFAEDFVDDEPQRSESPQGKKYRRNTRRPTRRALA